MSRFTLSPAWKALLPQQAGMAALRLRSPFAREPERLQKFRLRADALMAGKDTDEPQRRCDGNLPSITLMCKALNPHTPGQWLPFYEHKMFVQRIIRNIGSFCQWGVGLGHRAHPFGAARRRCGGTRAGCLHQRPAAAPARLAQLM